MKTVTIAKSTPRNIENFKDIRVSKGLEKYYLLSVGLMFFAIIIIGSIFIPPIEIGLMAFKGIAGCLILAGGIILSLITNSRVRGRKKALMNGTVVEGNVIEHKRKFNPTSSNRYFVAKVEYLSANGIKYAEVKSTKNEIFKDLVIGSTTLGIIPENEKDKVFFPAEVNIELKLSD